MRHIPPSLRTPRRGSVLSVELLLILPVLLVLSLGLFEFSMWLTARAQVAAASREGARVAATGGSTDEVQQAIALSLGPVELTQANYQINWLREASDESSPITAVAVTVTLPADKVVPNPLGVIGFSLNGQTIAGQTIMRAEF
jgi:hypothetical protein